MDSFSGGQVGDEAYPDLPVLRGSSDRGRAAHHLALRMLKRGAWLPWLQEATANLLALSTVVDNWPACLQHACLIPS